MSKPVRAAKLRDVLRAVEAAGLVVRMGKGDHIMVAPGDNSLPPLTIPTTKRDVDIRVLKRLRTMGVDI